MNLLQKAGAAAGLARVRFLGERVPVAARINLNNRCHSRCRYCAFWYTPSEEMGTDEVCGVIRDLARLGTKRLSISGGEPMLRDDIGAIIDCAAGAGISPDMNTSGYLFREKRAALRRLDLVKLSIDGREEVHDQVRGRAGAFRELEDAIQIARELGLKLSFAMTLTRQSLGEIPFVVDFARRHETFVAVQPVMAHTHAHARVRETYPARGEYQVALATLREQKRRYPDAVRNSWAGIEYISRWPDFSGLECAAGEVFVIVEPNGDVVPCDRITYDEPIPSARELGVEGALQQLPAVRCNGCGYCGSLELNMLMATRLGSVQSILRVIR